jgi:phosphohistidine phosphatase SixA
MERRHRYTILVRHATPLDETVDPNRPLSEVGQAEAAATGDFILGADIEKPRIFRVYHSPKDRAAETAQIISSKVEAQSCAVLAGLKPKDSADAMAEQIPGLKEEDEQGEVVVVIVSHLPFLSHLAAKLANVTEWNPKAGEALVIVDGEALVCQQSN